MKNKLFIISVFLFVLLFVAGCKQDFLEPTKELKLSVPEYYETLDESTISGITSKMYSNNWFLYLDKASSCLQEIYCGNAWTGDAVYIPFFNGTLNNSFVQLGYLWTTNYEIIKDCNTSINGFALALEKGQKFKEKVDASQALQTAVNTTMGELRFFRALSYFNLVRWFGPVPVMYDNLYQMSNPSTWNLITEEDIYEIIIRDLKDAIEKLPPTRNNSKPNKLSMISAKALLAKVYLTRGGMPFGMPSDYSDAAAIANDIITNSGGYELMATYHENFLPKYSLTNFPKECLWGWKWSWTSLTFDNGRNSLESYYAPSHFTQSWDGWSSVVPSVDLRESFEAKDLRRYSTIMEGGDKYPEFWTAYTFPGQNSPGYVYFDGSVNYGGPTPTGMNIRKHLAGRDNSTDGHIAEMHTEVYTPIIRLADVYLTYAEAILAKSASTSDALALVRFNTIRIRAGLEPLKSISYNDIWNERRHEFAFEFQNTDDLFRYYKLYPEAVKNMLLNQKRGKYIFTTEQYTIDGVPQSFPSNTKLKVIKSKTYTDSKLSVVSDAFFRLPYPMGEVNGNPLLNEPAKRFDFTLYK